jgi:ABC-type phosphate/phosphonate transport system permease subunit
LGRHLSEQLTRFAYPAVITTLLFFAGLTFLSDLAAMAARRALR